MEVWPFKKGNFYRPIIFQKTIATNKYHNDIKFEKNPVIAQGISTKNLTMGYL